MFGDSLAGYDAVPDVPPDRTVVMHSAGLRSAKCQGRHLPAVT
jgi:hypothetical protein